MIEPTSRIRCSSCGLAKPRSDYSMKPDKLRWYSACDRCRGEFAKALVKTVDTSLLSYGPITKSLIGRK